MNSALSKLFDLANKPERCIIGLMSGTSCDGLDVALCRFRESGLFTKVVLEKFKTIPYDEALKAEIRQVLSVQIIDFQLLTLLNAKIGSLHGELVLQCLDEWKIKPSAVDLIASHGQTVFHAPKIQHGLPGYPNATLQIGDGDHIAVKTGILTVSDFRQKHVAAGGEGAPLAVYGDFLLFADALENRILLNLGGIANFTFLPAGMDADKVFVSDTGPGNTMMDAAMRHYFQKPYDENGQTAATGKVQEALLANLKSHPFFEKPFPKTTGPEVFNFDFLNAALENLSVAPTDIVATLTRFTAETVADAIRKTAVSNTPIHLYVSGGGAHNPMIMKHLRELLPEIVFHSLEDLGISGDAKEAVLFATLANETVAGGRVNFGHLPSVTMGKISLP